MGLGTFFLRLPFAPRIAWALAREVKGGRQVISGVLSRPQLALPLPGNRDGTTPKWGCPDSSRKKHSDRLSSVQYYKTLDLPPRDALQGTSPPETPGAGVNLLASRQCSDPRIPSMIHRHALVRGRVGWENKRSVCLRALFSNGNSGAPAAGVRGNGLRW